MYGEGAGKGEYSVWVFKTVWSGEFLAVLYFIYGAVSVE